MAQPKSTRAQMIVDKLMSLDEEYGTPVPDRLDGRKLARLIKVVPEWQARIVKDQRVTVAPLYAAPGQKGRVDLGERRIAAAGYTMVELSDQRRVVLMVNIKGKTLKIFRYLPGQWEQWFEVDNSGDHIPLDLVQLPPLNSPELELFLNSRDARLAPCRLGPDHESGIEKVLRLTRGF